MLGLRFYARAFSSCGKRGPLFIAVRGPLTITASLVAEHRLQTCRLSSCGSRAQLLHGMWDLPRPGLEPVSPVSPFGPGIPSPPPAAPQGRQSHPASTSSPPSLPPHATSYPVAWGSFCPLRCPPPRVPGRCPSCEETRIPLPPSTPS